MKRAAIYARVSTNNGQNPGMQLEEIRTYCAKRGWEVIEEYVDAGISGAKEHRPALSSTWSMPEATRGRRGRLSVRSFCS
jgi:DNA invertase Pin-like site-specific DNA recombinase